MEGGYGLEESVLAVWGDLFKFSPGSDFASLSGRVGPSGQMRLSGGSLRVSQRYCLKYETSSPKVVTKLYGTEVK